MRNRHLSGFAKAALTDLYITTRHKQRVARADALLISFSKSGRTWLRVMIGKAIAEHEGLTNDAVLTLDKVARSSDALPVIVETHDGGTVRARASDIGHSKEKYRDKKVIFMVRDPRDIVVSAFFQASKRKKVFDGTLSEYLRSPIGSIDTIIEFYNVWARGRHIPMSFCLLRYEDLHIQPQRELQDVLSFLGMSEIESDVIERAVKFASFQNMRRMERTGKLGGDTLALRPADEDDIESYKTRRGKVGGYRDYLSSSDIEYLNHRVATELDPFYQY